MRETYEFEDDCVATIEEATSGWVVRWVDPEEGTTIISGFPSSAHARDFVLWADFEEATFKAESPYSWATALSWDTPASRRRQRQVRKGERRQAVQREERLLSREYQRSRRLAARRLGVSVRALRENNVNVSAADVDALLRDPPDWLVAEREKRTVDQANKEKASLRKHLTELLVMQAQDLWVDALKNAHTEADRIAADAKGAELVEEAEREAKSLAAALTPDELRQRIHDLTPEPPSTE